MSIYVTRVTYAIVSCAESVVSARRIIASSISHNCHCYTNGHPPLLTMGALAQEITKLESLSEQACLNFVRPPTQLLKDSF